MNKRITTAIAVYAVLTKDLKYLFARRFNTGYQDGNYQFPAGHVETGELPKQALIREMKEELGITLFEDELELVHVSARPKHDETGNRLDLYFMTSKWSGEIVNLEPDKCNWLGWVSPLDLPEKTVPHVRHAIECWTTGVDYSELGFNFINSEPLYHTY
jgi:8-oxo-dGTP diphosphatase